MPDLLSPDLLQDINELAAELIERFTPPEYIPGCTVKSIADKDEYAQDNGWIECLVAQHNQQRCRWRGQYTGVAVDDVVDVLYFKSYRLFVVFGQGGAGTVKGGGSGNWPAAGEIKLNGVSYTGATAFSGALAAAADGDTILIGSGSFTCDDQTISTANIAIVGSGRLASTLNVAGAVDHCLTITAANCNIENLTVQCSRTTGNSTAIEISGTGHLNIKNSNVVSASVISGTSIGILVGDGATTRGELEAIDTLALSLGAGSLGTGLEVSNHASNLVWLLNGRYSGGADGINITNGDAEFNTPGVVGGVTIGASATVDGYYVDFDENSIVIPDPGYIQLEELASDPTTPPTGSWGLYFKSGGLYHIDDAGSVTGPIT